MNKILNKLYELIPMDKTTRAYYLKQLLETGDNFLSILFSIQEHRSYSSSSIDTTPNTIHLKDSQISEILFNIITANSPKEVNDNLHKLDTKHQIVIKQLITENKIFLRQIVLENINKLYNFSDLKVELMKSLPTTIDKGIQYIIHTNYPLKYIYRSGSKHFTNIHNYWNMKAVPSSFCYLFDGSKVVAEGDRNLYRYFLGETALPKLFSKLPRYVSLEELEEIKNTNRGKYITILYKDEPSTEYIEEFKMEVEPFDWAIDDNYNPIGIKFMHEGTAYTVNLKITSKMLSKGLSSFKVIIGYNIKTNNKLTKIKVKEVINK